MSFEDKVIVITGAASGIARATAKLLAAEGAKISLADIDRPGLDSILAEIQASGGKAMATVVDVRDQSQVMTWIEATVSAYGLLDGAANLAGVLGTDVGVAALEHTSDADWDNVLGANVRGLLNCLRAEIPHVRHGGTASIVNAASIAGLIGFPKNAAYVAAKHAVVGLTRAAAKELGPPPRRIRCNCICPGPIDTPMLRLASAHLSDDHLGLQNNAMQRFGQPKEVAQLVKWLLSEESSFVSGTTQVVDGGWVC
ncbi:hypothetical protein Sste5346_006973 [Sporothrix stenoceras]|uniref:Ketoreductase domain-containing protein n=1 Tax=Sporothrix stenoceras TaxID=5173 RepID=A0ABR3YVQ0_9PEZI